MTLLQWVQILKLRHWFEYSIKYQISIQLDERWGRILYLIVLVYLLHRFRHQDHVDSAITLEVDILTKIRFGGGNFEIWLPMTVKSNFIVRDLALEVAHLADSTALRCRNVVLIELIITAYLPDLLILWVVSAVVAFDSRAYTFTHHNSKLLTLWTAS